MRNSIFFVLVLAACGSLLSNAPSITTAENEVWHGAYGRSDTPPAVDVVSGTRLTCTSDVNGLPGFNCPGAGCRQGCTTNPWLVQVAEGAPWSQTTLAHEYMHALKMRRYEIDTNHGGPEWKPGGAVDMANQYLREKGL